MAFATTTTRLGRASSPSLGHDNPIFPRPRCHRHSVTAVAKVNSRTWRQANPAHPPCPSPSSGPVWFVLFCFLPFPRFKLCFPPFYFLYLSQHPKKLSQPIVVPLCIINRLFFHLVSCCSPSLSTYSNYLKLPPSSTNTYSWRRIDQQESFDSISITYYLDLFIPKTVSKPSIAPN